MSSSFKPGDIVRLKSGGPAMTVAITRSAAPDIASVDAMPPRVTDLDKIQTVGVVWMDQSGDLKSQPIPATCLQLAVPDVKVAESSPSDAVSLARSFLAGGDSAPLHASTTTTLARAVIAMDVQDVQRSGVPTWYTPPVDPATGRWPTCSRCGSSLMYSARARGDGLCGPCSRGAEFRVPVTEAEKDLHLEKQWPRSFDDRTRMFETHGPVGHHKTKPQMDAVASQSDPDSPGPFGISTSWFTPERAQSKGLPLACDRCGLPFDRTGQHKNPPSVHGAPRACMRFLGRDEGWTCEGKWLGFACPDCGCDMQGATLHQRPIENATHYSCGPCYDKATAVREIPPALTGSSADEPRRSSAQAPERQPHVPPAMSAIELDEHERATTEQSPITKPACRRCRADGYGACMCDVEES